MTDFWSGETYDANTLTPGKEGKQIEFYGGPTPATGGISAVPPTPVPISAVVNPDGSITVGEGVTTTQETTIFGLSPLVVLGIAAVGAYFIFGSK